MSKRTVYLDHAATTPVDPRVLDVMLPYFNDRYGNASSIHHMGRNANVAVEESRKKIADLLGAETKEIVFTSGGTESDNTAIKGVLRLTGKQHAVTSKAEHHAVLHTVEHLRCDGLKVTLLDVDEKGRVSSAELEKAITDETGIVSIMHVNNEIGCINPIHELAQVCHEKDIPFHSDTVQSIGKLPVNVHELDVDFLSISAHKIYGPKGIGALYVRNGVDWFPFMEGGSQERRRRGGTLNVPGIVGLAKALELTISEYEQNRRHIERLQHRLYQGLTDRFDDLVKFNSDPDNGMYNIVNVSFKPVDGHAFDGEMLLLNLDIEGICCSNGSACTSGAVEPSHVLMATGTDPDTAKATLRFSIGKDNTDEDIDFTLDKLEMVMDRMAKTV